LGAAQSEDGDQNFAASVQSFVDLLQKLSFARTLGISDGCGVGGLGDDDVWAKLVDPCAAQVTICSHVEVTRVNHFFSSALDSKHAGAEDVASVVCGHFYIAKLNRFMQLYRLYFGNALVNHFL